MVPADVVEDAVEQHPQPALPAAGQQRVEVGVVPQPRVDPQVVDGVVAVRTGGEHRPEQQPGRAELDGVVQPAGEVPEPVHHRLVRRGDRLGPDEAEGIHVPPDGVPDPARTVPPLGHAGTLPYGLQVGHTAGMALPGPDPDNYPPIDPSEPVPDDPGELSPDTPETLPPPPVEPMPGPDDPDSIPGTEPEPV